jgi:hypothetical protein
MKSAATGVDVGPVAKVPNQPDANLVEQNTAPIAVERALSIYQQLQERDRSVVLQARKILTTHIFGMVDQGECDEQRLTVGGLMHLKAVERDHAIKSAHAPPKKKRRNARSTNSSVPPQDAR